MKFFLKSKTIIGALVGALVVLLPQFGITFTQEQGALINEAVDAVVVAASALLSVYGRFTAKDKLTVKPGVQL